MRRKATNRTNYREVCALYEATGRTNYQLKTVNDILVIHGFNIRETTGYEDLTEEQKKIFEAYVIKHMNGVGMDLRLTMWPASVHYVREVMLCGPKNWDNEGQRHYREELGKEYIILKADGKMKKWKKFFYEKDKTEADVDSKTETEFLRVDWKFGTGRKWFHVSKELNYY